MKRLAWQERLPLRIASGPVQRDDYPYAVDHIVMDSYFDEDGFDRQLRYFRELRPGSTELLCHPGYVDDVLRSISEWTDVREAELAVFCRREVAETLDRLGICRVHYGTLPAAPEPPAPAAEPAPALGAAPPCVQPVRSLKRRKRRNPPRSHAVKSRARQKRGTRRKTRTAKRPGARKSTVLNKKSSFRPEEDRLR